VALEEQAHVGNFAQVRRGDRGDLEPARPFGEDRVPGGRPRATFRAALRVGIGTERLGMAAGMSGSTIADAAGIGRIIIGMMTRDGKYPVAYAAAITASAAIIGPIIPPSIPMVVYALVSDASIGYLFLGGVIPGLLLGVAFMIMNTVIARRRNYPVEAPVPMRKIPRITLNAYPALMLPVVLLFGIYGGVMTPTEGAAAAAAYALLASTLSYRAMSWKQLYGVLLSSAKATTGVGMLIAGALAFNYVVTIENVPLAVQHFLNGFHVTSIA
jgi:tripartite ATP-independent transporter DctM subunit